MWNFCPIDSREACLSVPRASSPFTTELFILVSRASQLTHWGALCGERALSACAHTCVACVHRCMHRLCVCIHSCSQKERMRHKHWQQSEGKHVERVGVRVRSCLCRRSSEEELFYTRLSAASGETAPPFLPLEAFRGNYSIVDLWLLSVSHRRLLGCCWCEQCDQQQRAEGKPSPRSFCWFSEECGPVLGKTESVSWWSSGASLTKQVLVSSVAFTPSESWKCPSVCWTDWFILDYGIKITWFFTKQFFINASETCVWCLLQKWSSQSVAKSKFIPCLCLTRKILATGQILLTHSWCVVSDKSYGAF